MKPGLVDGTILNVRSRRWPLPGDVVVFRAVEGTPLVAHRLLGLFRRHGEWRFIAQGDALLRPDSAVPMDRLVGVATSRVAVAIRIRCFARFLSHTLTRLMT